jgi:hypothetical protein
MAQYLIDAVAEPGYAMLLQKIRPITGPREA